MSLLQALILKNYISGDGMEGLKRDAAAVVGAQVVGNAFPGAHPVLVGALAERITARLTGQQASQMSADELKQRVGNWAADTWIDNNFPALAGTERDALMNAIVAARGY